MVRKMLAGLMIGCCLFGFALPAVRASELFTEDELKDLLILCVYEYGVRAGLLEDNGKRPEWTDDELDDYMDNTKTLLKTMYDWTEGDIEYLIYVAASTFESLNEETETEATPTPTPKARTQNTKLPIYYFTIYPSETVEPTLAPAQ